MVLLYLNSSRYVYGAVEMRRDILTLKQLKDEGFWGKPEGKLGVMDLFLFLFSYVCLFHVCVC